MKKQCRCRSQEAPVDRKKLLYYGLSGSHLNIRILGKFMVRNRTTGAWDDLFYPSESKAYCRILMKNKVIKSVCVEVQKREDFPFAAIKAISMHQNIQSLKLCLNQRSFIQFSHLFKFLFKIKNLALCFIPSEIRAEIAEKKDLAIAAFQFGRHLLSKQFLETIHITDSSSGILSTAEILCNFFGPFGELQKACFQIELQIGKNFCFPAASTQGFLKKIEYLHFRNSHLAGKGPFRPNSLYLIGDDFQKFEEIMWECSSLKDLHFEIFQGQEKTLETFGLAKNIRSLVIDIADRVSPSDSQLPSMLGNVLLEAVNLEEFHLIVWEQGGLESILEPIHKALESSKVKRYHLETRRKISIVYIDSENLKGVCGQIANLQSLESLKLDFSNIEETTCLEPVFRNLTKLKYLVIDFKQIKNWNSVFPVESLGNLQSLEELEIRIDEPAKVFQQRLPRFASLKKMIIKHGCERLDIDYQKEMNESK